MIPKESGLLNQEKIYPLENDPEKLLYANLRATCQKHLTEPAVNEFLRQFHQVNIFSTLEVDYISFVPLTLPVA